MLIIVMMAVVGIPISVALFYLRHFWYGIAISMVVVITSILPIFFWFIVLRCYKELAKEGKHPGISENQNEMERG